MQRRSILSVILLFFCFFIIVPSVVFFGFIQGQYRASMAESAQDKAAYTLGQIAGQYTREINELEYLLAVVTASNDGQPLRLASSAIREGNPFMTARQLTSQLSLITSYSRNIASIVFFRKDQGLFMYRRDLTVSEESLRESQWYQEALENPGQMQLTLVPRKTVYAGTSGQYLLIAKHPRASDNATDIETVAALVAPTVFAPIEDRVDSGRIGDLLLVDEEGQVLTGSFSTQMAREWPPERLKALIQGEQGSVLTKDSGGRSVLVTHQRLPRANWQLVNLVGYEQLTGDNTRMVLVATALYAAFMLAFILLCVVVYRRILAPIRALEGSMAQLERGDWNLSLPTDWRSREMNALTASFLHMTQEIRRLIEDINRRETRKRELEIEALQYQINPHFMKNTLNSIRLLAMIAKNHNIEEVAESLGRIISTTLEKTGATCTLAEEIDLLKSYVHIMQVRYGNHFQVRFDIPPELLHCVMLKMLLQPILENAIYHGISIREIAGDILITAREEEGALQIDILDNGNGMTARQIQAVLKGETEEGLRTNRIGIINVIDRVHLNYGEEYGMSIHSQVGCYTQVVLRLPLLKKEAEPCEPS